MMSEGDLIKYFIDSEFIEDGRSAGQSASGGRTYEINAHAGSVAEALAMIDEAERGLRDRMVAV